MPPHSTQRRAARGRPPRPHQCRVQREGSGLLVTLFVVSIITVMLVSVYEMQMAQWAAVRNTGDYERALYLAGAAVHHSLAEIEKDSDWRDGIGATEHPAGSGQTYSATVTDSAGGIVVITGSGTVGAITRKLQVTIDPGD